MSLRGKRASVHRSFPRSKVIQTTLQAQNSSRGLTCGASLQYETAAPSSGSHFAVCLPPTSASNCASSSASSWPRLIAIRREPSTFWLARLVSHVCHQRRLSPSLVLRPFLLALTPLRESFRHFPLQTHPAIFIDHSTRDSLAVRHCHPLSVSASSTGSRSPSSAPRP